MRKFQIVVNGQSYEVAVEEIGAGAAPVQYAAPAPVAAAPVSAPAPAPVAAPAPAAKPVQAAAPAGSVTVSSPMPGTIMGVKVNVGDAVKKGQTLIVLEAMKMENDIPAPQDGVVAAIMVTKGASVNSGDPMVALN